MQIKKQQLKDVRQGDCLVKMRELEDKSVDLVLIDPPYNIAKLEDETYQVTLAVAGFKKSDIEIQLEDGTLVIKGTSEVLNDEGVEYLHKGIAERNFIRTFKLAEFVEVKSAKLEDGILRVALFRNVPDALKPQSIKIT